MKSQIKNRDSIQLFYQLLEQLDKSLTWKQVEAHLLDFGVSKASIKHLFAIYSTNTCETFEDTVANVNSILAHRSQKIPEYPLNDLRTLISHIKDLNINCKIIYAPLLVHNHEYYKKNLIFQIYIGEKKKGYYFKMKFFVLERF